MLVKHNKPKGAVIRVYIASWRLIATYQLARTPDGSVIVKQFGSDSVSRRRKKDDANLEGKIQYNVIATVQSH